MRSDAKPSTWPLSSIAMAFSGPATVITSATMARALRACLRLRSVVVFCTTAMRLPAKSATRIRSVFPRTRMVAPSMKVIRLKSTFSCRESVQVVVPHSTCTLPFSTASRRVCWVSRTHSTCSALPSWRPMSSATWRHRSTE